MEGRSAETVTQLLVGIVGPSPPVAPRGMCAKKDPSGLRKPETSCMADINSSIAPMQYSGQDVSLSAMFVSASRQV